MTRLYIELDRNLQDNVPTEATQDYVIKKAQKIMAPFSLEWTSVGKFSPAHQNMQACSTADGPDFFQNGSASTKSANE
jgi:hypothetical protein